MVCVLRVRPAALVAASSGGARQALQVQLAASADAPLPADGWRLCLRSCCGSSQETSDADAEPDARGGSLTLRADVMPPQQPGVAWLTAVRAGAGSSRLACAPLLVLPTQAAAAEMSRLCATMERLVAEQQPGAAAAELAWAEHVQLLLLDMHAVLAGPRSGAVRAEAASQLLLGVLEFLALHGAWCCVSFLLSEAVESGLLASAPLLPTAPAGQRLQQAQPLVWHGLAAAATAAATAEGDETEPPSEHHKQRGRLGGGVGSCCVLAAAPPRPRGMM